MKISKLFHWLYACLCFLPLFVIPCFALAVRSDNNFQPIEITTGGYVFRNKYETNEVNTLNDLQVNKVYHLNQFNIEETGLTATFDIYLLNYEIYQSNFDNPFLAEVNTNDYNVKNGNVMKMYIEIDSDYYLFQMFFTNINNYASLEYYSPDSYINYKNVDFYIPDEYSLISFKDYCQWNNYLPSASDFNVVEYVYNEGVVYNDTDVGSQLLYTLYVTTDKYLNFDDVLNLKLINEWININVFNNNAPLVWTIIWHYFDYWLLLSIFWLCFDVLIYVPQLAHRWLDKASLE